MLNTVARVGKVLKLFNAERPEWGVREVASTLELPKSNAHDMLASLASIGLLERLPTGRYRLGWRVLAMSRELVETDGLQRQAGAIVAPIARRLGHAASVAAWDGRRIVCVARCGAPQGVEVPDRAPGVRLPGHSTALGKVLLAHRPWSEVLERVEVHGLPRQTAHTVSSVDRLARQLEDARAHGVAIDREENVEGVACVAAPVRDASTRVVAALSISVPARVLRGAEAEHARAVAVAAHRLTAVLGASDGGQTVAALA